MCETWVKAEEFRDSPLGRIPKDWEVKTLGELANNSGEYGSGSAALEFNPDLPRYVRITDITDQGNLDPNSCASIDRQDAEGYYLQEGDLLFARSGATVGKTYLYNQVDGECAHAGYVIKFSLNSNLCNPRFVSQWTRSSFYWIWVKQTLRQGAQPNINAEEYKSFKLPCPPRDEQERIVEILDTVDDAIAHTSSLIAKLKQMKAGLLHDLLTRGLDENGELRDACCYAVPGGSAHPEQFKDSPLGQIPKDWEVRLLSTVAEINSGVTLGRHLSGLGTIELPYLRVFNVQDGYLDLSDVKTIHVYKEEVPRFLLQPGDVLMNEGGDYDKLGRGTVWHGQISPCLHQNHVFRVRPNQDYLISEFLALVSGSAYGKRFFIFSSKQSTNLASINSTQLKSFPIPCPPIAEQRKILDVFNVHDTRIRTEEAYRDKLKLQKQGLMHDLLTGKVRVKDADKFTAIE